MFGWRQWSVFSLRSLSEDVHIYLYFFSCLSQGGEENAKKAPSPQKKTPTKNTLLINIETHNNKQPNTNPEDDQRNGWKCFS